MAIGNTQPDGSGTDRWLRVDTNGRLETTGAAAENGAATGNPVLTGGRYDTADRTLNDGDVGGVAVDVAGRNKAVGAAAEDAAATGNPVQVGGRYDTADRTLDDGDVGGVALDVAGRGKVVGAAAEDANAVGNPVLVGGRYDAAARSLDDTDVGAIALNALARVLVDNGWSPSLQADEAGADSDKTFTVPANTEWKVKWIWAEYTSTAAAGNRQLAVQILDDAADVIAEARARVVQAASLTRYYLLASVSPALTAFYDTNWVSTIMPEWYLPAGYQIRVWDNKAIAAAADTMVVQMMVEARSV